MTLADVVDEQAIILVGALLGGLVATLGLVQMLSGADEAAAARRRRLRRIKQAESPEEVLELLRAPRRRSLASRVPVFGRLPQTMQQAGIELRPWVMVMAFVVAVLVCVVVGAAFLRPVLALPAAVMPCTALLALLLNVLKARRINKLVEQLPDALELMARGLRVGHPLSATVLDTAHKMPPPISAEFEIVADQIAYGDEIPDAFDDLGERLDQEDFRFLAAAVSIQAGTGGNLARVLKTLATVIRGRFTLAKKIRAISSEGRLSMRVLSALPFVIFAVVSATSPSFYRDVSDDPLFAPILITIAALIVVNYLILRRLVNFRV